MNPSCHPSAAARHRLPASTSAAVQVLLAYLVAILLLQGFAAAFAVGAGPLHRHRTGGAPVPVALPLAAPPFAATIFLHARSAQDQAPAHVHDTHVHDTHAHATQQRHHHADLDTTVVSDAAAQAAADAAAHALGIALSLMAVQTPRSGADHRSHERALAAVRLWRSASTPPLYRPPSTT